jgi:hypothetical protein
VGLLQDAGLKNFWDEICVGCRQDSIFQGVHQEYLRDWLAPLISQLDVIDLWMVWLQTYDGELYARGPDEIPEDPEVTPEDRVLLNAVADPEPVLSPSEWPIRLPHVVDHILNEYVLRQCINYENKRITRFTEE